MCFYQDECAEVFRSTTRTARKPHQCDCCCNAIEPKSLYEFGSGIFEGDPFTFKSCGVCELLRWIIHVCELADGCRSYESWPSMDDELFEAAKERRVKTPTQAEGQRWLKYKASQAVYRATHQ